MCQTRQVPMEGFLAIQQATYTVLYKSMMQS